MSMYMFRPAAAAALSVRGSAGTCEGRGRMAGGFTFVEVLLAIVILSLTGLAAAGAIFAATAAYETTSVEASARALLLDYESAVRTELERAMDIHMSADGSTLIYTSVTKGSQGYLTDEDGMISFVSTAGPSSALCPARDHLGGADGMRRINASLRCSLTDTGAVEVIITAGDADGRVMLERAFTVVPDLVILNE